ncbi:XtrA/YqaO family protein [Virgibacillus salarius]|uniref:XtrA/YqaO family protein n=1 Tax=Virgibacillus salarius TaxID=447199 RepID=UPI003CD0C902
MRLKNIPFKDGKLNVDIDNDNKPFVVVYSEGEAKLSYLPNHGETKVITHYRVELKGLNLMRGEEF